MACLAFFLTPESAGTVTASIAATPSLPAWVATSLVVADLILSLASFAAELASLVNLVFSSSVKLVLALISSNFLETASSTNWFAACLASSRLGTLTL